MHIKFSFMVSFFSASLSGLTIAFPWPLQGNVCFLWHFWVRVGCFFKNHSLQVDKQGWISKS